MKKNGFVLVEIIIILVIAVLLGVIAVPYLTTSVKASQAAAKETLRKLSIAAENYAASHNGAYPASIAELSGFIALADSYCANAAGATTVVGEYSYACILAAEGYTFTACPVITGAGGGVTYTAATGGVLAEK
ncbi:MAG: hypothetical protein PHT50_00855 [Candidatus Omnitrophica bacterium]|nr:hypothetical protein [Candidatus Omnitrophota bacterium]